MTIEREEPVLTGADQTALAGRSLFLRDSLALLRLLVATLVIAAVTLFLFRSFTSHRVELAQRWSQRAVESLAAGRPKDAIPALRTALTYAPGERKYEMLLAEALGEAGETDQSYNYFMGLWATEPGNGNINLELARLAAKRAEGKPAGSADRQAAVNFYRAAIYGTWEGDGIVRRSQVRLELAGYLLSIGDMASARAELLIAGGNAPGNVEFDRTLADLLDQSDDPGDAEAYRDKAAVLTTQAATAREHTRR